MLKITCKYEMNIFQPNEGSKSVSWLDGTYSKSVIFWRHGYPLTVQQFAGYDQFQNIVLKVAQYGRTRRQGLLNFPAKAQNVYALCQYGSII